MRTMKKRGEKKNPTTASIFTGTLLLTGTPLTHHLGQHRQQYLDDTFGKRHLGDDMAFAKSVWCVQNALSRNSKMEVSPTRSQGGAKKNRQKKTNNNAHFQCIKRCRHPQIECEHWEEGAMARATKEEGGEKERRSETPSISVIFIRHPEQSCVTNTQDCSVMDVRLSE
jgi:hypothetical protein